uniref:Uncharacterized protein n=1 Tax=Oryza glumipatula TaxID=40148 RepID=A0A0E0B1D8_9ORYZ
MPAASSPAAVTNSSGRFSLDFLPDPDVDTYWVLADSHGGLLLLVPRRYYWGRANASFPIAICEPLTRRHRTVIPPLENKKVALLDAFLLGSDGGGEKKNNNHVVAGVSNVTVLLILYTFRSGAKTACIFSTVTGGGADEELRLRLTRSMDLGRPLEPYRYRRHALRRTRRRLPLLGDFSTGEFSSVTLPKCTGEQPRSYRQHNLRAIGGGAGDDAGEGRVRIIRLVNNEEVELLTPLPLHGICSSSREE